jgi:hypothetical protein
MPLALKALEHRMKKEAAKMDLSAKVQKRQNKERRIEPWQFARR